MMLIQDLIRKKRDKKRLTSDEIKWFVQELCKNEVEPAQTGAFLMAAWINGLSELEKINFTNAMKNSGTVLKCSGKKVRFFDKPSYSKKT
jgi:thymidine phosphorylase